MDAPSSFGLQKARKHLRLDSKEGLPVGDADADSSRGPHQKAGDSFDAGETSYGVSDCSH
jgi:hypothetical protein